MKDWQGILLWFAYGCFVAVALLAILLIFGTTQGPNPT